MYLYFAVHCKLLLVQWQQTRVLYYKFQCVPPSPVWSTHLDQLLLVPAVEYAVFGDNVQCCPLFMYDTVHLLFIELPVVRVPVFFEPSCKRGLFKGSWGYSALHSPCPLMKSTSCRAWSVKSDVKCHLLPFAVRDWWINIELYQVIKRENDSWLTLEKSCNDGMIHRTVTIN